jgi:excisionase family DNA binding protein
MPDISRERSIQGKWWGSVSVLSKANAGALTVQQVAKMLSVSEATVNAWIAAKKLKAYRLDGTKTQPIIRILKADLDEYLSCRSTVAY